MPSRGSFPPQMASRRPHTTGGAGSASDAKRRRVEFARDADVDWSGAVPGSASDGSNPLVGALRPLLGLPGALQASLGSIWRHPGGPPLPLPKLVPPPPPLPPASGRWGASWGDEGSEEEDSGSGSEDCDEGPRWIFEVELEGDWVPFDPESNRRLSEAKESGQSRVDLRARGHRYVVDLEFMAQTNRSTGMCRPIRCREEPEEAEDAKGSDEDDKALPGLEALRDLLRRPPPPPPELAKEVPHMGPEEIRAAIVRRVPEAESWVAPRSNDTPAIEFLIKSYDSGLPAFPSAVRKHLAEGVRLVVWAAANPAEAGVAEARADYFARQLAEAFTNCQAVQARTIDALQAEIRGVASHSLPAQLRALVEEHREMALDRTVCHFHPYAHVTSDSSPTEQLPHLSNRYRRHLGREVGLGGARSEAADADRNASGRLPVPRRRALARFWREFRARELLGAVVADVNQTEAEAQRRIDRDLLMAWAGSHAGVGYRIFYDESAPHLYGDFKPSTEQVGHRQPVLHEALALELMVSALGPAGAAGSS
mmetsp:Transcript_45915/g.143838  ORF Transcript_45915/g.143838 Transcript_45915/m.143838 type:complete len:539 (-) Transcript_45915:121-1737(-)